MYATVGNKLQILPDNVPLHLIFTLTVTIVCIVCIGYT